MSNGPVLVELWKDEVKKSSLEKLTKKIMDLIVQLLPIITPLIWNQLTCSLPKNVTNFHGQQDGCIISDKKKYFVSRINLSKSTPKSWWKSDLVSP